MRVGRVSNSTRLCCSQIEVDVGWALISDRPRAQSLAPFFIISAESAALFILLSVDSIWMFSRAWLYIQPDRLLPRKKLNIVGTGYIDARARPFIIYIYSFSFFLFEWPPLSAVCVAQVSWRPIINIRSRLPVLGGQIIVFWHHISYVRVYWGGIWLRCRHLGGSAAVGSLERAPIIYCVMASPQENPRRTSIVTWWYKTFLVFFEIYARLFFVRIPSDIPAGRRI